MRSLYLAAGLMIASAGVAQAQATATVKAEKPFIMVCDRDGMAERQIRREHGSVAWTTSSEVVAAVRAGQGWSAPRCMTNLEHWRMTQTLGRMQQSAKARTAAQRVLASR